MNIQEIVDASSQIEELLTPLAEKIGQTGEYLFGLFFKQVYVNALTGLLWWPIGGIFCWGTYKLFVSAKEIGNFDDYCAAFFLGTITLMLMLFPLNTLIRALINPDYQAILLIIKTLKAY